MADINPTIAMGYKPVEIQDPVNQIAKYQDIAVNNLKMQEYQRGLEEQNALRTLRKSGVNPKSSEYINKVYEISPELGMKMEKQQLEARKLGGEVTEQDLKVAREQYGNLAFNTSNENVLAHLQDGVLNGRISQDQAARQWQQIAGMSTPQRKQYFEGLAQTANQRLTLTEQKQHNRATEGIGWAGVAEQKRAHDLQYNPELQGEIAGKRKAAEAKVEEQITLNKDIQANRKALQAAGYDVATGKDEVTDLIKKSTGSYIGKARDVSGALVGKSTEGAKALAALETRANTIAFGLLNGKLGTGVSNDDRKFIVAQLGTLADGTIPTETRLAAWNQAKDRMKSLGMLDEPSPNTPSGNAPPENRPSLNDIFKSK